MPFRIADGQLRRAARDPDLILTLECSLLRVLGLTVPDLYSPLGTTSDELVSAVPSRSILNSRKKLMPYAAAWHGVLSQRTNLRREGYECPNI